MVVGRLLSYWEGNFSGAMLNFGGVYGLVKRDPYMVYEIISIELGSIMIPYIKQPARFFFHCSFVDSKIPTLAKPIHLRSLNPSIRMGGISTLASQAEGSQSAQCDGAEFVSQDPGFVVCGEFVFF